MAETLNIKNLFKFLGIDNKELPNDFLPSKHRYIGICDILGFKNKIYNHGLDKPSLKYWKLIMMSKWLVHINSNLFPNSGKGNDTVHHTVFSDSILIWSDEIDPIENPRDLGTVSSFFDVCNSLIAHGILFNLPIRAGISFGKVCIGTNSNIYVGEPIIEAYQTEQKQKWIGGACHDNCKGAPHFKQAELFWRDIINYKVPITKGVESMYALNWINHASKETLDLLESELRNQKDLDIINKYKNTITFLRFAEKKSFPSYSELLKELKEHGYKLVYNKKGKGNNK